jgi:hypothetical protein
MRIYRWTLSIFVALLFSTYFVSAQELEGMRDVLHLLGGIIFLIFSGEWLRGIDDAILLRGAFSLLVFTIVFWGAAKVEVLKNKGPRTTIALVFAIIGAVFLPVRMVSALHWIFPVLATAFLLALLFQWLYVKHSGAQIVRATRVMRIVALLFAWMIISIFRVTAVG